MNKPEEDAEEIKNTILEKFGGIYDPLEEAMEEGPEALVKAGLTEEWVQAIPEVSETKIRLERSKVRGTVAVKGHNPGRVQVIPPQFTRPEKHPHPSLTPTKNQTNPPPPS